MLGYKNTTYQPKYNAPPAELIVPVAVVPVPNVDHTGTNRTPNGAGNLSSTTGATVNFKSASWQAASWTFEPFTVVTWRVFRQQNPNLAIRAGGIVVAYVNTGSGWIGGTITLDDPQTVISISDATASRCLVNVWVA